MQLNWKEIFASDSGTPLDIRVFRTTSRDWQMVLDYLSARYTTRYAENGAVQPMPRFDAIWAKRDETSFLLEVELVGLNVHSHFFRNDQIEMDIRPEDVNSKEKAELVFGLMAEIAFTVNKKVFLIGEYGSATEAELERLALCFVEPCGGSEPVIKQNRMCE